MTKILFLGDIFSRVGRQLVRDLLPSLKEEFQFDLALANAENAAGGRGLTQPTAQELFGYGLAALSGGNHTFQQKQFLPFLELEPRLIRPANYPAPCPGRGWTALEVNQTLIGFGNLIGRIFMSPPLDCPFRAADQMIADMVDTGIKISLIDFHAETTSEKIALAHYLDGRLGALLGTHTHVQTADAQIRPQGLAYITDVGLTGPHDSVIGMNGLEVVESFLTGRPQPFKPSGSGARLDGVLIEFGENGRALRIQAISRPYPPLESPIGTNK
ncbi:MAG: YmdB family metallophosphoesterase [Deltaproteobacteria bacterium]|jgi:metallophosphoesterase (TIGR00282 family)|nr:YmdB family metallophosphoesterase [Deltaproteobacteria bacterium]